MELHAQEPPAGGRRAHPPHLLCGGRDTGPAAYQQQDSPRASAFPLNFCPSGLQTHTGVQTLGTHKHTGPSPILCGTAAYLGVAEWGPSTGARPGEQLQADLSLLPPATGFPSSCLSC